MVGLRDPRLYAAVGGLLACSAAATVAFTAGDRPPGGPGPGDGSGPLALPAPSMVVPAPADPGTLGPGAANPVPRVPTTRPPSHAAPARTVPVPRAWHRPTDERTAATREDVREVLDRVDEQLTAIAQRAEESGATEGVLVLPVPRADVAALLARVGTDARCSWSEGRADARDDDDDGDGDGDAGPRGRHHRAVRDETVDEDGSADRADGAGADENRDDAADGDRDGADADDDGGRDDADGAEADENPDDADADEADEADEDGDEHRDRDDEADDEGRTERRSAERDAMALLVTASPDDDGALRTRAVDPDRVLAVLADLHGSSD